MEESGKAQISINAQIPILVIAVLLFLMIQLQSFSRTLMVVLTAPLGLIGVVGALLLFHMPFGFVAMLGTIAMFGIIMRNSVILVDQIEQDIRIGHSPLRSGDRGDSAPLSPHRFTSGGGGARPDTARCGAISSGPMATALMGGITVMAHGFDGVLLAGAVRVVVSRTPR